MLRWKSAFLVTLLSVVMTSAAWSQSSDVAATLGYPDMIVHNAKIATVDDASFTPRVGTIVQAMAIRDGRILATGTNDRMLALAGPSTEVTHENLERQ